jgi:RNA-directed DNA polymerase
VERKIGVESLLENRRSSLKDGSFRPLPVHHTAIPKFGGKVRHLGVRSRQPILRKPTARPPP